MYSTEVEETTHSSTSVRGKPVWGYSRLDFQSYNRGEMSSSEGSAKVHSTATILTLSLQISPNMLALPATGKVPHNNNNGNGNNASSSQPYIIMLSF